MIILKKCRSLLLQIGTEKKYLAILFAILCFIFGITTIFITPPLQGPNEELHFIVSRKAAKGDLSETINESLVQFCQMHGYLVAQTHEKYSLDLWKKSLQYQPSPNEKKYLCKQITFYAIPSYLPATIGIGFSQFFSNRYAPAMYAGRIFCLLTYIALGTLTLLVLPGGHSFIFLLLLMPQSIFQASIISYDGITNGAMALWAALLFRDVFTQDDRPQTNIQCTYCKQPVVSL